MEYKDKLWTPNPLIKFMMGLGYIEVLAGFILWGYFLLVDMPRP